MIKSWNLKVWYSREGAAIPDEREPDININLTSAPYVGEDRIVIKSEEEGGGITIKDRRGIMLRSVQEYRIHEVEE